MKNQYNMPEIGRYYNCFDDGKISHSRVYKVYIYKIMSKEEFLSASERAQLWWSVISECDNLYDKDCDTFVLGVSEETDIPRVEIFAKTKDGGWFGLGELNYNEHGYYVDSFWCCGRLDIDDILYSQLQNE